MWRAEGDAPQPRAGQPRNTSKILAFLVYADFVFARLRTGVHDASFVIKHTHTHHVKFIDQILDYAKKVAITSVGALQQKGMGVGPTLTAPAVFRASIYFFPGVVAELVASKQDF